MGVSPFFFYVVSARKEEWVLLGGFGIMYA